MRRKLREGPTVRYGRVFSLPGDLGASYLPQPVCGQDPGGAGGRPPGNRATSGSYVGTRRNHVRRNRTAQGRERLGKGRWQKTAPSTPLARVETGAARASRVAGTVLAKLAGRSNAIEEHDQDDEHDRSRRERACLRERRLSLDPLRKRPEMSTTPSVKSA